MISHMNNKILSQGQLGDSNIRNKDVNKDI